MAKPSPWELWTLNFELCLEIMAEVEPTVRAHGLEMKEFFLLGKLDEHPYPAELARALITPKPTVTFMVKRMEAAGFVERETEAGDLTKVPPDADANGTKNRWKRRARSWMPRTQNGCRS